MTDTLKVMEDGFRTVLGLPESWFVHQYRKALHFMKYNICIFARILGFCSCSSWGAASSMAIGGLIGTALYLIGLFVANKYLSGEVEEAVTAADKEKREALDRMVKEGAWGRHMCALSRNDAV